METSVSPTLLALCQYRWNLPVVACLHQTAGVSFVALVRHLNVSRDALSRTLEDLLGHGWIGPRPRSEPGYRLTATGRRFGPPCEALLAQARRHHLEEVVLRRWTLPVSRALHGWSLHFGELKSMLPEITPRALALALKEMESSGLLEREIESGFPPSACYRLTPRGKLFLPTLKKF